MLAALVFATALSLPEASRLALQQASAYQQALVEEQAPARRLPTRHVRAHNGNPLQAA